MAQIETEEYPITPEQAPPCCDTEPHDTYSLTYAYFLLCSKRAERDQKEVATRGSEVSQRQDQIRRINSLICELNALIDDKGGIDLRQHPELQEQLRRASECGIRLDPTKTLYNSDKRTALLSSLHLMVDQWDKDNRSQTQEMEIYLREFERILSLLKDTLRNEHHVNRTIISGIRGGG